MLEFFELCGDIRNSYTRRMPRPEQHDSRASNRNWLVEALRRVAVLIELCGSSTVQPLLGDRTKSEPCPDKPARPTPRSAICSG